MNINLMENVAAKKTKEYKSYEEFINNKEKDNKDFINTVFNVNKTISKAANNLSEVKDLLSKRHTVLKNDDVKHTFTSLSSVEKEEKTKIQNNLISSMGEYVYNGAAFVNTHRDKYFKLLDKVEKEGLASFPNKSTDRDVINLFKPRKLMGNEGEKVFDSLVNASNKEERSKIFDEYFNKLMDCYDNNPVTYKGEKDFSEHCKDYMEISSIFSSDTSLFKALKNHLGIELNKDTLDRYEKHLDYAQIQFRYFGAKANQMMEESYKLFTEETVKNINEFIPDDEIDYEIEFEEYNSPLKPLITGADSIQVYSGINTGKNAFSLYKLNNKFNDKTSFVGPKGIINEKEASLLVASGNRVDAIKEDGSITKMQVNQYGFIKDDKDIMDNIDLENIDDVKKVQDKFKEALKLMNDGTSIFNKSSKEYKDMRGILSDLSKGTKDREAYIDGIKKFKDISKTYLENHDKKEKVSSTALKRKNCVLGALNKLDELNGAFDIDPNLEKDYIKDINNKNIEQSKDRIDVTDVRNAVENFDDLSKDKQEELIKSSQSVENEKQSNENVVDNKPQQPVNENVME